MTPAPQLTLAMLQTTLIWEQPAQNMRMIESKLQALPKEVDLVVLPEMFTSGFTMSPQRISEPNDGPAHQWLAGLSASLGVAICGSVAAQDDGGYYNRLLWADGGVCRAIYDKRHLFRMAGEHEVYTAGRQLEPIAFKGWKVLPRICYDLRFPVWSRNTSAHLQLYVANWPAVRIDAWDKLLMARAIENQCYVAGVNRVGTDGNGVEYSGHSVGIDFKGHVLGSATEHGEELLVQRFDFKELEAFRQKFPAHLDADRFTIQLDT